MNEKNTKATETVEIDPDMGIVSEEIDPGMSIMPGPGAADTPTVIPELDSMLAVVLDQLPAYTTTDWKNKPSTATPVTAEIMKKIEQRIVDLTSAYNNCATEIKTLRDSVSQSPLAGAKKFMMKTSKARVTFDAAGGHRGFLAFSSGNSTPWLAVYTQNTVLANIQHLGNVTVEKVSDDVCDITAPQWSMLVIIPLSGTIEITDA